MNKTYQPFIVNMSNELIQILDEQINFFQDEEIKSTEFAKIAICDLLTEKFLKGELTSDDEIGVVFNEEEFSELLHKIVTDNALRGLMEKGLINFLEDENGEEMFFLTSEGKKMAQNIIDEENKKKDE